MGGLETSVICRLFSGIWSRGPTGRKKVEVGGIKRDLMGLKVDEMRGDPTGLRENEMRRLFGPQSGEPREDSCGTTTGMKST